MRTSSGIYTAVALCAVLAVVSAQREYKLTPGRYNTTSGPKDGVLNVHVVPHTQDDVGWLKTVDEYYIPMWPVVTIVTHRSIIVGANNSIQNAGVQYILDSVMWMLSENPDRKFIYVEIAFFKRWWQQQTPAMQDKVRGFVKSGQLEFINGGWCMSDEAAPYYVDMVDQQTLGHQFLLKEFGTDAIPKTGWQIDPFGHSATMGTLFALMGMDSWFFGRIDYQDRALRQNKTTMETIMFPSASLGDSAAIFTGVTNGYGPPGGFNWDAGSSDAPMQDDDRLEDVNIKSRVEDFVNAAMDQNKQYRTGHIMFTMGSDFEYSNANTWYKNLDKLIHYANLDGRVNAFYSTPTLYTKAKHDADIAWPTKHDDWFPYADSAHAFWTGYFTSRPALKGYVRTRSSFLQSCRQLELATKTSTSSAALWEALGLAQHHDAVSGTEKQHVAFDYARHLSEGTATCETLVQEALGNLIANETMQFETCPFLNNSICTPLTEGSSVAMVLYNNLGQSREEYLRLPTKSLPKVYDPTGQAVPVEAVVGDTHNDVVFKVQVPAFGYSTYVIDFDDTNKDIPMKTASQRRSAPDADVVLENSKYKLSFDGSSGLVKGLTNKNSGVTTAISQNWAWYNASTGNVAQNMRPGQASGAYIFRPNCTEDVTTPCKPFTVSTSASVTVFQGAQVHEIVQTFAPWIKQTFRLYEDADYIEQEFTVGPIPFNDGLGKEIVSVWNSDIANAGVFFTDSNGRDMQTRKFNHRETWDLNVTDPVSGNFYPVDSSIYFQDNTGATQRQFAVTTDRACGGASLADGEMEVMVHRRLLVDDRRGVGEPLNETGVTGDGLIITGTHRITFDVVKTNDEPRHDTHMSQTFPLDIYFTPYKGPFSSFASGKRLTYSNAKTALPKNIHLLHAHDNSEYGAANSMILRLAHQYETGESATQSGNVTVDLTSIFAHVTLSDCVEMSLTANQKVTDVNRYTWKLEDSPVATPYQAPALKDGETTVTISPMQIRTFTCTYSR